ncbi:porin family protein [Rubrivirga litoralis]|uniref:Porin family protein n=1 Tax=Rubrivirga litoralis TaxID=3075598 RepID=A0ABU3BM38_9BACT|nr:porin family protein [Rubrivirga sp. F394]MDT0630328.1 porin family protein [Rubrivirga sp. F394]
MTTLSGRLLLLPLAFFLALPASAQASFGAKAGLNTSFFSGDDAVDSDPRLGFVGGLTARYAVSPSLAVQAEALYSQKGDRFDNDLGFTEDTRLDYIEIPAMLRLGVPLSPLLDAGVVVGGYVGFPVRSEIVVDGTLETELDAATDYGALVGVDIGSGPVFLEGRYTVGLTDAIDFDPDLDVTPSLRNQVVSFTIGYRFGGGRSRYGR